LPRAGIADQGEAVGSDVKIYPVIMCGGAGTRLWPASTPRRPKQFIPLLGPRSSLQETIHRIEGLAGGAELIIVAGADQEALVAADLTAAGVQAIVILEPVARDSAAAMAAAAILIAETDPDGVAVVMAADHHVPDAAAFRACVEAAAKAAADGFIVTLGVRPLGPSTAYGYIQPGDKLSGRETVSRVAAFVEKPDAETAASYVRDGLFWNSGNFVVPARLLLEELETWSPATAAAARKAVREADRSGGRVRLSASFAEAPKISIDYAVMEKTDRAAVIPAPFHWSDIGAWDAVWTETTKDAAGNAVIGQAALDDVRGSLVHAAPGVRIAVAGLEDVVVVADEGAVLVCRRSDSQKVKSLVDRLGVAAFVPDYADLAQAADTLRGWLFNTALPLWWALGADHENGGFHEALTRLGPTPGPSRVRVPARQSYAFARAGLAGWSGPWRHAALHGLADLERRYRRQDGFYSPDETSAPLLYDQAFILLAWAQAHIAELDGTLPERADQLLDRVEARFTDPAGGFREHADKAHQSNPLMHLFEAAMLWSDAVGGRWTALADALADLATKTLMAPVEDHVLEFYAQGWTGPAPGEAGRVISPGHQFEWAFLLAEWARRRARPDLTDAAGRLYEVGRHGVDSGRLVVIDEMDVDYVHTDPGARLWPQTERLKAACVLGRHDEALEAANALGAYLTPGSGLWRDRMNRSGGFDAGPSPASSLYHIAGAILQLDACAGSVET